MKPTPKNLNRRPWHHVFSNDSCQNCVHDHVHSNDNHTDRFKADVSMESTGFAPKRVQEVIDALGL